LVSASMLFMDHSLDESELDCRASYESVWRSSENAVQLCTLAS
jgi:hypothetical protein